MATFTRHGNGGRMPSKTLRTPCTIRRLDIQPWWQITFTSLRPMLRAWLHKIQSRRRHHQRSTLRGRHSSRSNTPRGRRRNPWDHQETAVRASRMDFSPCRLDGAGHIGSVLPTRTTPRTHRGGFGARRKPRHVCARSLTKGNTLVLTPFESPLFLARNWCIF